jgi:hypothetical protein
MPQGGKIIESNEAPRHIVRAFVRQEISDQVATAARNYSNPILSIFLEDVALEWIDLVANYAGHHGGVPRERLGSGSRVELRCRTTWPKRRWLRCRADMPLLGRQPVRAVPALNREGRSGPTSLGARPA